MLKLNDNIVKDFIDEQKLNALQPELDAAMAKVLNKNGAGSDFLGWADLPVNYDKDEFERIKAAAEKIKKTCDIFVVIGIGGSYLGARAAIEFVKSPLYNNLKKDTPDIYFIGNSLSESAMSELLEICEGRDICVNVISKSGKTTEPGIAFRIFKQLLEDKYGIEGAKERIYATTGLNDAKSALNKLSLEMGYDRYMVPDDIGGRYSVLTAVGLLPIAVAGIDIDAMMAGAAKAREELLGVSDFKKSDCAKYAAIRNALYRDGKAIEIMAAYEPAFAMMSEWWKQLYGESEGKDGKALFPASVVFSTDLHSLGQIIQQGVRNIFETAVYIYNDGRGDVKIGHDDADLDNLNYIEGMHMRDVNTQAFIAT
nr:glucose-6-phosphate isomerase [Clostridia bacterium]